jgi:hypothetical protein
MNLLDIIAANEARDKAIEQVGMSSRPEWIAKIRTAILDVAANHGTFTTDEVWQYCEDHAIDPPHEPRALGAVIRELSSAGEIVPTMEYRMSARAACHRRPIRVWRKR